MIPREPDPQQRARDHFVRIVPTVVRGVFPCALQIFNAPRGEGARPTATGHPIRQTFDAVRDKLAVILSRDEIRRRNGKAQSVGFHGSQGRKKPET